MKNSMSCLTSAGRLLFLLSFLPDAVAASVAEVVLVVDCMLLERLCWGVRVCSSERSVGGGRRVVLLLVVDMVAMVVVVGLM